MRAEVYAWFIKPQGGLKACVQGLHRNKPLREEILKLLIQVAKEDFFDVLVMQMPKLFGSNFEYLEYSWLLLDRLAEHSESSQHLVEDGVVAHWLDLLKELQQPNIKKPPAELQREQQLVLKFYCEVWISFPAAVEAVHGLNLSILEFLKMASRASS